MSEDSQKRCRPGGQDKEIDVTVGVVSAMMQMENSLTSVGWFSVPPPSSLRQSPGPIPEPPPTDLEEVRVGQRTL